MILMPDPSSQVDSNRDVGEYPAGIDVGNSYPAASAGTNLLLLS